MKRVIIALTIVMAIFANIANAEIASATQSYENVHKYAVKFIPDVTADEVEACYNAVKNGGHTQIKRKKVKIECDEEEMIVFRRLF